MKHFDFWGFKRERSMSLSPSLLRRKVTLKSSNSIIFEIDEAVAFKLQMIKFAIEDCDDNVIQLPNVMSKILEKLVEYCKRHVEDEQSSPYKQTQEDLKTFDFQFVKVDDSTLFDLIHAANCLNIKSLLDLTCGAIAEMIKGKTPQEIKKTFNLKNEFTPGEEEEDRRENAWAFE